MMGKHRKEKMSDDAFSFLCFMVASAAIVVGVISYQVWEKFSG